MDRFFCARLRAPGCGAGRRPWVAGPPARVVWAHGAAPRGPALAPDFVSLTSAEVLSP
jgi:hypothetical protein